MSSTILEPAVWGPSANGGGEYGNKSMLTGDPKLALAPLFTTRVKKGCRLWPVRARVPSRPPKSRVIDGLGAYDGSDLLIDIPDK